MVSEMLQNDRRHTYGYYQWTPGFPPILSVTLCFFTRTLLNMTRPAHTRPYMTAQDQTWTYVVHGVCKRSHTIMHTCDIGQRLHLATWNTFAFGRQQATPRRHILTYLSQAQWHLLQFGDTYGQWQLHVSHICLTQWHLSWCDTCCS